MAAAGGTYTAPLPDSHRSAAAPYARPPVRGVQFYAKAAEGQGAVGQDYRHMAADLQVGAAALLVHDWGCTHCVHMEFHHAFMRTRAVVGAAPCFMLYPTPFCTVHCS